MFTSAIDLATSSYVDIDDIQVNSPSRTNRGGVKYLSLRTYSRFSNTLTSISLTLPLLYHGTPTAANASSYTIKSDSRSLSFQDSSRWRRIPHSVLANWTSGVSNFSSRRKRHTMVPTTTSSAFVSRCFCIVVIPKSGAWRWTSERLVLVLPEIFHDICRLLSLLVRLMSKNTLSKNTLVHCASSWQTGGGQEDCWEQKLALVVNERQPERYGGLKRLMGVAKAGGSIGLVCTQNSLLHCCLHGFDAWISNLKKIVVSNVYDIETFGNPIQYLCEIPVTSVIQKLYFSKETCIS